MKPKNSFLFFSLFALLSLACSLTTPPPGTTGGLLALPARITATPEPVPTPGPAHTLTPTPPPAAILSSCFITTGLEAGRVNLRFCPGLSCDVTAILTEGDRLTVITSGDWLKVQTGSGLTGYVNAALCEVRP